MKPVLIYASDSNTDTIHAAMQIFMVEDKVTWDLYHKEYDMARYLSIASTPRVNTEEVHDMK